MQQPHRFETRFTGGRPRPAAARFAPLYEPLSEMDQPAQWREIAPPALLHRPAPAVRNPAWWRAPWVALRQTLRAWRHPWSGRDALTARPSAPTHPTARANRLAVERPAVAPGVGAARRAAWPAHAPSLTERAIARWGHAM